ncbi:MAG: formylglycine-generating enzyme family protein [Candidatus Eiseniibacteriota bacterium]|nr:MAG: formylglycine-generating enzyme family protein [Candidatus Eisenbacteria bacterium]
MLRLLAPRLLTLLAFALFLSLPAVAAQETGSDGAETVPEETAGAASDCVVIPGGEFLMGSDGEGDHAPAHRVRIDSFCMDKYEVTNAQYAAFCQETGRKMPEFWGMGRFRSGPDFPDHPVTGVSWRDAEAYAEWCGKRLPTEAEWEYAARGGLEGKAFPYGDTADSTLANYTKSGEGGTVAVGSYPANGFGLHDMAGNVSEWVSDYYDGEYYGESPSDNPKGPEEGKFRVFRGGGWHSGPSCTRVFYRNALPTNWVDFNVGFRCAKDLD